MFHHITTIINKILADSSCYNKFLIDRSSVVWAISKARLGIPCNLQKLFQSKLHIKQTKY